MVSSVVVGVSAAAPGAAIVLADVVEPKVGGFALNRSKIDCSGGGFAEGGGGGSGGSVGCSSLLCVQGSDGGGRLLGLNADVLK